MPAPAIPGGYPPPPRKSLSDVALGTRRIVAQFDNLDFLPMQRERYDLIVKKERFYTPEIQTLLQVIRSPEYQNEIAAIGDNDYSDMGKIVGEV